MAEDGENMSNKKSDYIYHSDESAMSGYLYKKTRDNRWQKRWFETNGVYLTYYKSRKMEKLLAALSLPQVGEIKVVPPEEDPENDSGLFTLELNTRIYTLKAKSDAEAQLWVNTLNKLRQDGLIASAQHTKETTTTTTRPIGSMEVSAAERTDSNRTSVDWIKTGRSCCGCC